MTSLQYRFSIYIYTLDTTNNTKRRKGVSAPNFYVDLN